MNKKIFISLLSFLIVLLFIPTTYAYDWTVEDCENAQSKCDYETYYAITEFYATPNIDSQRVIKEDLLEYLTWYGCYPYYSKEENVYMEVEDYFDKVKLIPHLANQNSYARITNINQIESFNNEAEYIIGMSSYDQIVIMVDGDTFKDNLGDILNDFLTKKYTYEIAPEFYRPYAICANPDGSLDAAKYKQDGTIYMYDTIFLVGFNLTKESEHVTPQDPLDDPGIYGGNDEVQIDDTPTQPEVNENYTFKIIGIVASSILSIMGIYIVYLLIKKIYLIMKG